MVAYRRLEDDYECHNDDRNRDGSHHFGIEFVHLSSP
jgi:hypothetical protein